MAPFIASNAFYYYSDLEAAARFYGEVLGFDTVADYGFAKILRLAPTSYLTLVDVTKGMHSADEPKTVAIAILTDQLDEWFAYLQAEKVPMKHQLRVKGGSAHDGFVAIDPEGYLLEFERFNHHPENEKLMPVLDVITPLLGRAGSRRPADLGVKGTVVWLYYDRLQPIERFYEDVLGLRLMVDQGWAKVYPTSPTGFLGLVDGAKGMHSATDKAAVNVSFFTDDVAGWFERLSGDERIELRHDAIQVESDSVHVFVGYDPGGYFLEFDTFIAHPRNDRLLQLLGSGGA
jgi:catechol 2,3-dioxygenase-like lactoylglutathione lyase family enzyme